MTKPDEVRRNLNEIVNAYTTDFYIERNVQGDNEPLSHYTCFEAVQQIFNSDSLLISHYSDLNDIGEIDFGINVLKRILISEIHFNDVIEVIDNLLKNNITQPPEVYIFSVSRSLDQGLQWLAYGNNGKGVSIEFNKRIFTRKLITNAVERRVYKAIFPVFYFEKIKNEHDEINYERTDKLGGDFSFYIKNIFDSVQENVSKLKERDKFEIIAEYIVLFASIIKNSFFKDENEERFIIILKSDSKNIEHQDNKKKYRLSFENLLSDGLVENITIGPKLYNDEQRKNNLEKLVYKYNKTITVNHSKGKMRE